MAKRSLTFPDELRDLLGRRFVKDHRAWLVGEGVWPLDFKLGMPSEAEALAQPAMVQRWMGEWGRWSGPGKLVRCKRRWRSLGVQQVPERLRFDSAEEIVRGSAQQTRWTLARERYTALTAAWPPLASKLGRHFDLLADGSEQDVERLRTVLAWLQQNPCSDFYARQLPIPGLDSKWLERRKGVLTDLVSALSGQDGSRDFFATCGLRAPPPLIRIRVLDRSLRSHVGGMSDVTAPVEEIAKIPWQPDQALILENVQTGLALGESPGSVALMGLGYAAADVLSRIPWLARLHCVYWGDLDTHGFVILSQARKALPGLRSALMDADTLHVHRDLWGVEQQPYGGPTPGLLSAAEADVFEGLRSNRWGQHVRLEQERIDWGYAWPLLSNACADIAKPGACVSRP